MLNFFFFFSFNTQFFHNFSFHSSNLLWCSSIRLKYCFSTADTRNWWPLYCWCTRPFSSRCFSISTNRPIRRIRFSEPNRNKRETNQYTETTKIKEQQYKLYDNYKKKNFKNWLFQRITISVRLLLHVCSRLLVCALRLNSSIYVIYKYFLFFLYLYMCDLFKLFPKSKI